MKKIMNFCDRVSKRDVGSYILWSIKKLLFVLVSLGFFLLTSINIVEEVKGGYRSME